MNIWRSAPSYTCQKVVISFYISVYTHAISFNSLDSSVGILTGCRLDGRGSIRIRDFYVLHSVQAGSAIYPASDPVVPMLKRQGREADHSPLFSAEVKNGGQ
jgi:hypothetical protein